MRWTALAFGLVVYAAALLALAPATLLDARLQAASGGRLRLAEAHGSLWAGQGWIEIRDADGTAGVARPLAWRVGPLSLLRGGLVINVVLEGGGKPFPVRVSPSRIELQHAGIQLPATVLGLAMPKLAPLRLSGEVLVTVSRLSMERGRVEGDATVQWRAAGSALTPLSPLGDYEVRLKAAGAGMQAVLSTLEGPLQLEGKGTWSSGTPPSVVVTARIPPQHQDQLSPIFRFAGVERGAGNFELRL